ncbi:MAG: TRAP transporter large permease subunit, partial [Gammaproteobacteria bacterium]
MAGVAVFAGILLLVLIDVPIAVALGLVAVVAMVLADGASSLVNLPVVMYTGATSFPLIAIPLFILAGAIMNA